MRIGAAGRKHGVGCGVCHGDSVQRLEGVVENAASIGHPYKRGSTPFYWGMTRVASNPLPKSVNRLMLPERLVSALLWRHAPTLRGLVGGLLKNVEVFGLWGC